MKTARHTHQTTIRFSDSLWARLERAADEQGISVAQYVRDAAKARLAEEQLDAAGGANEAAEALRLEAAEARQHSLGEAESSAALWEQGRLARERARMLRDESRLRRMVRYS